MTSIDFCNWLKGFLELTNEKQITEKQKIIIQQHLSMVFAHEIDLSYGDKKHQSLLSHLHHDSDIEPGLVRC